MKRDKIKKTCDKRRNMNNLCGPLEGNDHDDDDDIPIGFSRGRESPCSVCGLGGACAGVCVCGR